MRHLPATIRHAQALALEMTTLSPAERITLAAVIGRLKHDGTGSCFAGYATLETDSGIPERSLRRHLIALCEQNILAPAARGWGLGQMIRTTLFPAIPVATHRPDTTNKKSANVTYPQDKMADRRERGERVSPTGRLSPDGESPAKPEWLTLSDSAYRMLVRLAEQGGKALEPVLAYAKKYVEGLNQNRTIAYLKTLLSQDKDWGTVAKHRAGDKAKREAQAKAKQEKEDRFAMLQHQVFIDTKGHRWEVAGHSAHSLTRNFVLVGAELLGWLEVGKLRPA